MTEKQSVMRPIDVVILLKKLTSQGRHMNGKQLAESLGISAAEVSVAMERNRIAKLVDETKAIVNVMSLREFLIYGIRYSFPIRPGSIVRGVPTASSASPIKDEVSSNGEVYVWRDARGLVRGQSLMPLYKNISIAIRDEELYALLVIVDSLRIGKSRERQSAVKALDEYLDKYGRTE